VQKNEPEHGPTEGEKKGQIFLDKIYRMNSIFLPFQKKGLKESDGVRHRHLPYLIATAVRA
jgi:hypothetical protein